jgi:hypothetical protein
VGAWLSRRSTWQFVLVWAGAAAAVGFIGVSLYHWLWRHHFDLALPVSAAVGAATAVSILAFWHRQGAGEWLTGRAEPPAWLSLLGFLVMIGLAAALFVKRGAVVGTAAAVVYGGIGLSTPLAWQRTANWSKRHRLLDSLLIIPLLFFAIAYITKLSTGICLLIALPAGLALAVLGAALRRAKQRTERRRRAATLNDQLRGSPRDSWPSS